MSLDTQELQDPNQPIDPSAQELPERMMVRMPRGPVMVVYIIMALTILVYAVQMLSSQGMLSFLQCPYFSAPNIDIAQCYGMKINELILAGQWWRLIAPVLLHGSLLHIGFNMYALYVLGPELERHFGHLTFLALYLVSGFSGFVLSFLLTDAPSLGASTAIFGLLAAEGVFIYRNQRIFGPRAGAALRSILQIAVINFVIGLSPGIDNWGHLGGVLGGALFAWFAAPVYEIGGQPPEFHLINTRSQESTLLATLLVTGVFALLAATRFF